MAFSATNAALEGFRVIGRRPFSILAWAIFYAVATAALVAVACLLIGPTFIGEIMRHHHDPSFTRHYEVEDVSEMWEFLGGLGLAVLILVPGLLILAAIQLCSVFRAVLRPDDRGFFYLRLGGDEFRQVLLMILMSLFFGVVFGGLVGGLVGGLRFADLDSGATVALAILGGVVIFVLLILLAVRLSLAQPMTFAERRLRFFGSWGLTKGVFWPLVGMYILSAIFCIIVAFALEALAEFVGGLLGFSFTSIFDGENFVFDFEEFSFEDLAATAGWGGLAYAAISMISTAMQLAISYAPQAAAYRDLIADRNPPSPMDFSAAPPTDPHGHGDDHGAQGAHGAHAAAAGAGAMGVAAAADHAHAADHGADPGHAAADAHGHDDHGHDAHGHDDHDGHGHHDDHAAHPAPAADDHGHGDAHGADHAAVHPAADDHGHADHGHNGNGDGHGDHGAHADPHAGDHAPDPHAAPDHHPDPHHPDPHKDH